MRTLNRPTSRCATGSPPIPPIRTNRRTSQVSPPSRRPISRPRSNSAEAQFQLGVMAAEGTGGPKDDVPARALFEKAAAQNHAEALLWMGAFAEIGRGGPKDASAAKAYYEKAAAFGNDDAKAALKRM